MARRKSSRGRVFYYPSSLPKMQNGGGTNQQNNEYATTLDLISTYKGYNPSAIKEMLNKIAWHETGMTLNPKQLQGNDPKKPGKGLYQFEKDSLTTAIQRAKNFYKSVGEPVPDWINNLNTTDATTLSASQQSSLAALDMVQRKNFPVRQALESDEGLVEAWAKGWQTKNDPAKKELFKEHLEIYKDKGIKTELPTVNSLNPLIFFDPRRTLPKFQNGSRIENGTDSNDTVYVEKDPATGLPKLKKGGNIQKKGYKYNSPYRNRRYIDIHSNKITMDDVPERLLVRTDTGEERILEPNSGEYYFPGANVVREIPLRDTPLYFSPSSTGLTKYEPGGGILSEPVSGDVPTTLLPEINITGFKDNSYSFTGLPTIAPESSKTGKKCSAKNCAEQGTTEFANIVGTTREEISPLVAADAWYRRSKVLSNPNNELIFEAKTADYDGYKNLPVKPEGDWWKDIDFQVGDFVDLSGKILGSWRNKSKQPKLDAPSKEGYSQSNFARHSGVIIGKTPEGIPIVRHNIDGILYDEPITDISKKYNYFPSAIYRVNDENLNKGKQQYSIKQQEKYENITNYLDESLDLPFTGTVTDDEGNTLKVDTKKVNKKLVEPYKEIRRDLVVNYGVSQERLDDIFKTLLAIGTQESNLGNMVDDKFISKAKVSVLDILADVPIGLINPLLTGFSSESVLKTAKGALNVKGQIENLLSDYKVAEVPTWKLDKEIALLEAQGVPNDEAIHQIFSQYGAPSKTDKVTDPSKGPFRQKEPSGRWLETMGKEYSTTEAMRKANWGKEWDDSNKNFIANAIGLYLDNYDQAKKLYGENESEEFLNQVATLAHNAPTKAFTKEYTDFYIKGIDNPDPAKYNAGYVNKVYNAKNSMFRQPKSSRENSEGTYRGFIDKSAESSNQQQNANTPLVDVPSYFSGSKINLTRYQKGGFLPKYQKGDKIPTYMLPEVEVQAFPNATPAQKAALSTGPGNPIYRSAKLELMKNNDSWFPIPDNELRNVASASYDDIYAQYQANLDKAYNFATQWMSSPRYKEMLNKSGGTDWWTNSHDVAQARINNLNKIQSAPLYIKDDPTNNRTKEQLSGTGGYSKVKNGLIYVNQEIGLRDKTLYDHEISHSIDRPINKSLRSLVKLGGTERRLIPVNDINLMTSLIDDSIPLNRTVSFWERYGDTPEEGTRNYFSDPTEVRARLNEIRRILNDEGVDVFNNKITPDDFNKVLEYKPVKGLKNIYSDENILKLLNTISYVNDDVDTMSYAKLGGQLPRAQVGLDLSNLYNKAKNLITESEELDYAKRLVNTLPQYLNPKTYSYSDEEGLDSIPNYNKYNNFSEAFKQAREDLGRGQTFLYNGKRYTTNKENEFPNDESETVFNTMTKTLSPEQKNKAKEYYFKQGAPYLSLGADDTKFNILPNAQVSFSDLSNRAHVNPVGPYNKVYLETMDYDFTPDEISEYEKSTGKTFYGQDVNLLIDELAHIEQVRDKGTGPFFKHFFFDGLKGELQKKSPYDMEGAIEHSAHQVIGPKRLKEIMGYQNGGQLPRAQDGREQLIKKTKDWWNSLSKEQKQYVFMNTDKYKLQHEILFTKKQDEKEKIIQTLPNKYNATMLDEVTVQASPSSRPVQREIPTANPTGLGEYVDELMDGYAHLFVGAPMEGLQTPQSLLVEGIEAARGNDYNFKNAVPLLDPFAPNKQRTPSQTFLKNAPFPLQLAGDILIDPFAVYGAAKGGINALRYLKNFPKAFTLNLDNVGAKAFKPSLSSKQLPGSPDNFIDYSKYLTQEEAVQARAERMLSQKDKWVGQPADLENKFKNAVKNHEPAADSPAKTLGVNSGNSTKVSKDANLSDANKSRIAAHETGHYYRNVHDEAVDWNSFFNFDNISNSKTVRYLKGKKPARDNPNQIHTDNIDFTKNIFNKIDANEFNIKRNSPHGDEIRERAAQLKDYIAQKNGIPLNQDFTVTRTQLDDALKNYVKDTGLDNAMTPFIQALKDKEGFLKAMNKYALTATGVTAGGLGAGVVGSQYFSNPQEQVEYRNGGQLPRAEVMIDPATGLPKLKKGGKAWIQGAIKKPGASRAGLAMTTRKKKKKKDK